VALQQVCYGRNLWEIVLLVHGYEQDKVKVKGKGKAIPLQALTFPQGSRRLRLPDLKTIGTRRW
jgi:hypothetical protein